MSFLCRLGYSVGLPYFRVIFSRLGCHAQTVRDRPMTFGGMVGHKITHLLPPLEPGLDQRPFLQGSPKSDFEDLG